MVSLLVPLVAVTAGTALSVIGGPRPRILLPIRGFALAAVVTSVAAHLVPEAMMSAAGVWALLAFAIGLWLPLWLGHLRRDMAEQGTHRKIASELGFAAVLLHQVGDGVALGALGHSHHSGHENWDLLLGILAHTVPLAAVVTLPFVERGLRQVVLRAGLLVAASAVGVVGAEWLASLHTDVLPWFSAVVAGTLLHILSHDEPAIGRPAGLRGLEVLAMLAGAILPALLAHEHEREVLAAMGELTLTLAPILLLGLAATVLLRAVTQPPQLGGGRGVLAGFRAALRWPACACEVTATSQVTTMPSRAQLSFLLVAPELHLGTLLVTAWMFGGWWMALRAALAMLTAAIAVYALRRLTPVDEGRDGRDVRERPPAMSVHWARLPMRDQIAEAFVHAGPWLAAGLVVASWLLLALPPGALAVDLHGTAHSMWLPFVTTAIAVLTYVCAWSATPVAAVLVAKGLAPELAIAGLVIGTITNREVLRALAARLGRRAVYAVAAMVLVLTALGAELLASGALASSVWPEVVPGPELPRALELACAVLLGAGSLLSLWRYGLNAWLEPLLADAASGHRHHQHDETEPCRDGCHEPARDGDSMIGALRPRPNPFRAHDHDHHGHDHAHGHHHGHDHHHEHAHGHAPHHGHAPRREPARAGSNASAEREHERDPQDHDHRHP